MPSRQYCSSPLRQLVQVPHEFTMQPTPTRSPTWWRVTSGADLGDDTDDLVARHDRERLGTPVAVDGVDVGVADAGVLDLDEDVVGPDVAALDRRGERAGRRPRGRRRR